MLYESGNNLLLCLSVCSGESYTSDSQMDLEFFYPKLIHRLVLFPVSAIQLMCLLLLGEEKKRESRPTASRLHTHTETSHFMS